MGGRCFLLWCNCLLCLPLRGNLKLITRHNLAVGFRLSVRKLSRRCIVSVPLMSRYCPAIVPSLHYSGRGNPRDCCMMGGGVRSLKKTGGYVDSTSMSRKGNCWDNAVAESFFGSLKVEQVFGTQYPSRSAARPDIVEYIEMFYNSRRRHSSLGYMNPMEFEKQQLWKKAA